MIIFFSLEIIELHFVQLFLSFVLPRDATVKRGYIRP
jgi:hypothetical protein